MQVFSQAVAPPEGVTREGQVYWQVLGRPGTFDAEAVRREMGEPFASAKSPAREAAEPAYEFVEL